MNTSKRFLTILNKDKALLTMFSGIVLIGITLISMAIMTAIWYL